MRHRAAEHVAEDEEEQHTLRRARRRCSAGVRTYFLSVRAATWPEAVGYGAPRFSTATPRGRAGRGRSSVMSMVMLRPRSGLDGSVSGSVFVSGPAGEGQEHLIERRPAQRDVLDGHHRRRPGRARRPAGGGNHPARRASTAAVAASVDGVCHPQRPRAPRPPRCMVGTSMRVQLDHVGARRGTSTRRGCPGRRHGPRR